MKQKEKILFLISLWAGVGGLQEEAWGTLQEARPRQVFARKADSQRTQTSLDSVPDLRKRPPLTHKTGGELRKVPPLSQDPSLWQAARAMESMVLEEVWKTLRQGGGTGPGGGAFDSPATLLYRGMLDSEYAQKAAQTGHLGLAEQLVRYWSQRKEFR